MSTSTEKSVNEDNKIYNSFTYKDEFMDTKLREVLFDDVRIFFADHKLKKKKVFHPLVRTPPIQMHFLLEGEHTLKSNVTNHTNIFKNNQHNLIYLPHSDLDFTYESSTARLFGIQLTENFFSKFIDESSETLNVFWGNVLKQKEIQILPKHNLSITPNIKSIIYDILNSNHKGFLRKLFIEAKIMELFVIQFEQITNSNGSDTFKIKYNDMEKLYYVKELLEENILSKFSLLSLARKAGLNDFKLKRGFKELFGTTVFNYLNDLRMDYSKKLILDEKKSISETAFILGYSEPQHFSAAFKKRFGYRPSELK